MTDHERVLQLAALSLDFELTPEERAELDGHRAACPSCESRVAKLRSDAAALAALPRIDAPERVRRLVLSGDRARRWRPAFTAQALVVAVLVIAPLALAVLGLRNLDISFGSGAGGVGEGPPTIVWQRVAIPPEPATGGFEAHAVTRLQGAGIVTVGLACADLAAQTACRAASAVSADGITWTYSALDGTLAVEPLPDGSWVGMRDAAAGGPGIVAVGVAGVDGRPRAAVWLSSDGIEWDRVPDDPGFADSWMNAVISLDDDGLLAVGGAETASGERAALWRSADARSWTRVPDGQAFDVGSADQIIAGRPVAGMWDVSASPDGLTAVGAGCPPGQAVCTALAWVSAEELTWTRLPDTTLGDGVATAVTPLGQAVVAVGRGQTGGVSWRSTADGVWTPRALPPARSGGLLAAAPLGPRTIAAGTPGAERSGIWATSDALTWTFERSELFDGATILGLHASGETLVAVGALRDDPAVVWLGRTIAPAP